jgi:hypothetical protein
MISAESLTSSATSLFWLTGGLLALTVILAVVGVFTLRATITRKRRLLLTITSRSQLLSAPESMRDELQIKYNGEYITGDPYVTAVELANVGKTHISSRDFDGERQLKFSLGRKIIKLLATEHSPSSAPVPVISADDTMLSLMPELIAKGEIIKVAVLTEGRPTEARVEFTPFGDIAVDTGDREVLQSRRGRTLKIAGIIMTAIVIAMMIIAIAVATNTLNEANNTTNDTANVDECEQLTHDTQNMFTTLLILDGLAAEIEIEPSVSSAQISSYSELDEQAQAELLFLGNDYQDLVIYGFLPKTANVISVVQKASKTLPDDGIPKSKNDVSRIAKHIGSVEAALTPKSTIPSACGSS